MSIKELSGAYSPKEVESKWYAHWKQNGFFKADSKSKKPSYCIVIPPPNVTGVLHMGHALVNSVQDILIRWKRMSGFEALWVPGTDHAGIATQTVVERNLISTTGKRRKDFPREEFLGHVWDWKEKSETRILEQLERLGCSCDWDRKRFTMDEGNNRAVNTIFKKLYDEGLIYRGDYLVNWDPVTQTALADDEVDYEERSSYLWYFSYPLEDGSPEQNHIIIATTRPETMLGDTAVAVAPNDPRYAHLIGKKIKLPLTNRLIPIIADHHVDPEFGTGCVKITPAHDPNDYQMGMDHNLEFINIMTPDGKINENGGCFAGLTMEEARAEIVTEMTKLGLFIKTTPHIHRVGLSYRSKAVIEPYMSKQWFVKMSNFATKLKTAVEEKKVKLIPQTLESTYFHWVENLRDWCISRQLWWGHRIPVWYNKENPDLIICHDGGPTGKELPPEVIKNPEAWEQEEDVLDTWFSSALWPFATLGWPDKTDDLKKFYPNSVLVTAHDILFFWVARMICMGEYIMGEVPFPETFLHGLIYGKSYWRNVKGGGIQYVSESERIAFDLGKPTPSDVLSKWEKMSKSKGNVIDPLELIDTYGTDAVRMALAAGCTQARQMDLDRRKFEEFKNFTNKIWNGARFIFMNLEGDDKGSTALTPDGLSKGLDLSRLRLEDKWILSVLNRTIAEVNEHLTSYSFDQAASKAYDFYWKELCAYYLEIAKPTLFGKVGTKEDRENKQKLLVILLCQAIRLMHPMAPFITEELFSALKERFPGLKLDSSADPYTQEAVLALINSPAIIVAPYPKVIETSFSDIEKQFEQVSQVVYTIRNIRGEMRVPPAGKTDVYIVSNSKEAPAEQLYQLLQENSSILTALIRIENLYFCSEEPKGGLFSTGLIDQLKIIIPLPEELRQQEKGRLIKEEERLAKVIEQISKQLGNESFRSKAPAELIQKHEQTLLTSHQELASIKEKLSSY